MSNTDTNPPTSGSIVRIPLLTAHIQNTKTVERVEVRRIEFAPYQRTGYHLHPCPVIGLIVKGSVVFQIEGQPASVLQSGEAFFEPAHTRIAQFDAGAEGATFVAYYLLGPGENEMITMLGE